MRIADELQVDCPVFYVDNVAEYFDKKGKFEPSDLPVMAPPLIDFWIEYASGGFRCAARVDSHPRRGRCLDQEIKWISHFQIYFGSSVAQKEIPFGFYALIPPDGSLRYIQWDERGEPPVAAELLRWVVPLLGAISFMHCKNVRHVEHEPKIDHKFLRATGKKPRVRYYTLEIDPMREVLRREGKSETVGLKQALHICRGHFKDYRQSGLFGKIKGIFWWDSQVRGSPEHGAVVKDYAIKAPDGETLQ